jgi:hypothetical protein
MPPAAAVNRTAAAEGARTRPQPAAARATMPLCAGGHGCASGSRGACNAPRCSVATVVATAPHATLHLLMDVERAELDVVRILLPHGHDRERAEQLRRHFASQADVNLERGPVSRTERSGPWHWAARCRNQSAHGVLKGPAHGTGPRAAAESARSRTCSAAQRSAVQCSAAQGPAASALALDHQIVCDLA